MSIKGINNSNPIKINYEQSQATPNLSSYRPTSLKNISRSIMQGLSKLTSGNKTPYGNIRIKDENSAEQNIKNNGEISSSSQEIPDKNHLNKMKYTLEEYGLATDLPLSPTDKCIQEESISQSDIDAIKNFARKIHEKNGIAYMNGGIFISDGFAKFLQTLISKLTLKAHSA